MIALWSGTCSVCGFTGKSIVTRSCPLCGSNHQRTRAIAMNRAATTNRESKKSKAKTGRKGSNNG